MGQQRTIGKYQILERIASGSQGTVDRAFDPVDGRLVAIKVLRTDYLENQSFIDRFRREASLAAAVDHPNVVRIYEVGEDGDRQFIAMEFLPENLSRLITQGQMSAERTATLVAQIADGLGAIHDLGIVHRDMKPHNVLITPDGAAKITDFGIARGEELATITATGVMMGTPHYMAPEQAEGDPADARSDVYALGCMMYQMLAGEVPFTGNTPVSVLRMHVDKEPKPILDIASNVPMELVSVLERAMSKDPDSRFVNGHAMARALRKAVPEIPAALAIDATQEIVADVEVTPFLGDVSEEITASSSEVTAPPVLSESSAEIDEVPNVRAAEVAAAAAARRFKVKVESNGDDEAEKSSSKAGWVLASVVLIGISAFITLMVLFPGDGSGGFIGSSERVEVVHWSTGHLTHEGLLPTMAEAFNKENHRTADGTRIQVKVFDSPSELQAAYLIPRVKYGTKLDLNEITNGYVDANIPDPTILTPSSAHWLVSANYELGRDAVDITNAKSIVRPVIGIVTYEDMARCLGWPEKELGFADIIALRDDPDGWASYPCAKASWGQQPLLAFTDPTTSSTGRSLHLSLYSIGAGKSPEDLTVGDVNDQMVVEYVENFQTLIDHYLIGTTVLNTKIYQGKKFGHFFVMPEDNLIHLYEGTERAYINGEKTTAPPITESMVMIYPKEGSMPRNNCACIVDAEWVTPEQVEASKVWIDYIREDEQQRAFMAAGFRPGTDISLDDPASKITSDFGLNPSPPRVVLNPSLIDPEVAAVIDENWIQVKRPGIVNFVVDTSGSMAGEKLRQAKEGLTKALDSMAANNRVGFISFSDSVRAGASIAPLTENRFQIASAIDVIRADGGTALYDAVREGIRLVDTAEGDDDAIRAVVVLTDGQANAGSFALDDIVSMSSVNEILISEFSGLKSAAYGVDELGFRVNKVDIIGSNLLVPTRHDVQIFFIGIGDDADIQVGRILAGATSAEFQGIAEDDLAALLEEFSKYF